MSRGISIAFLFAALIASGQLFPSDGLPFDQAEDKELIETVCPSRVEHGGKVNCGRYCPSASAFGKWGDHFDWDLVRVTRGHFLSPTSEDAVISTEGCEPHSTNFGGSILLTRRNERWRMLWYEGGVKTQQCHKIQLKSGREILVCLGEYGGQGNVWKELYVEDLLTPVGSLMSGDKFPGFFSIEDSTLACGFNQEDEAHPFPVMRANIEDVEFKGESIPIISVKFTLGKTPMTFEAAKACFAQQNNRTNSGGARWSLPQLRRHQMNFAFDGHSYKPTPASAALAKRLELQ
jgi:hypothetical protein